MRNVILIPLSFASLLLEEPSGNAATLLERVVDDIDHHSLYADSGTWKLLRHGERESFPASSRSSIIDSRCHVPGEARRFEWMEQDSRHGFPSSNAISSGVHLFMVSSFR